MCSGDGHLLDIAYFGHFGQQTSLHDFRFLMHFPSYARSIVHVFQGAQGIWWGGLGGGVWGCDNVRWNFHTWSIYSTCFSTARERTHAHARCYATRLSVCGCTRSIYDVSGRGTIIKSYNSGDQKVYISFNYHLNSIQLSCKFSVNLLEDVLCRSVTISKRMYSNRRTDALCTFIIGILNIVGISN